MLEALKHQLRFSFLLGGKDFKEHSPSVEVETNGDVTKTTYLFSGGLRVTNTLRVYPERGACDWVNEWENTSDTPTEIISELWDCDVEIPFLKSEPKASGRAYLLDSEHVVKVFSPRGSDGSPEEFSCDVDRCQGNKFPNWFAPGSGRLYSAYGGRSSGRDFAPFFNIKHGKEELGIIAAVGWTGQWNAYVERREESIVFRSKIEDTNFRIYPGERFRTSSVTLMEYKGTMQDGQNKWRRLVKDVYAPIGKGQAPATAPFCAGLWGGMSSQGCIARIKAVEREKLPFDHYWMDAGWYGTGTEESPDDFEGDWAQHTGNWVINKTRHPDEMQGVVDEIKKSGKRFLLWFEPERVRRDTPIVKEHPEYLIFLDESKKNILLDLGNPQAWEYCFDTLCSLITRLNISVYRQDFNFSPLAYWRKNDTEDRRGITEIKHINGLYRLWDTLLEKFPDLLIDNCASGGRRIDVEALRRSVLLWRSDAQCSANWMPELTQAHALSHSAWLPYSGTGSGRVWFDTYRFRSAYAPGLMTNYTFSEKNPFGDDPERIAWLKAMCDEYLRVRPYLSEDVYPLTIASGAWDIWSAVQYHDPKKDAGVVQAFRRERSPYKTAELKLFGLSPDKEYVFEDADGGTFTVDGKTLLEEGLSLSIKEKRTAKVYFYKAK